VRAFAHDVYSYPLPPGHRFPLEKYPLVRAGAEGILSVRVTDARRAAWSELRRAHSLEYLARVRAGALDRREQLALGLPWSERLVERARRATGATLQAADAALADGVAMNLGGGTHHAFADAGRGFCLFNDVVIAIRMLRPRVRRVLVVDLDVHQGDGTHSLLLTDSDAFTFAINGFGNYPFQRVPGDLELDLPNGTGDERYIDALARLLPQAVARSRPELCFYLAGADPYAGDRLGRLSLTREGLSARDRFVRDTLVRAGVPLCVALAGGYAQPIEDTVAINLETVRIFGAAA
jgi:acetoin utilization deacetylase AcuC-like enzyme